MYACLPSPTTCRGTRASADRLSATPRGPLLRRGSGTPTTWRCCVPCARVRKVYRRLRACTHASLQTRRVTRSRLACKRLFDAPVSAQHVRPMKRRVHFHLTITLRFLDCVRFTHIGIRVVSLVRLSFSSYFSLLDKSCGTNLGNIRIESFLSADASKKHFDR